MDRRWFLRWAVLGSFVAPLGAILRFAFSDEGWERDLPLRTREAIRRLFSDFEAARSIGERYLDTHPEDAVGVRMLARHIDRHLAGNTAALRSFLSQQRSRNFHEGDVVLLDGWVVARAEARACALAALA